MIQNIINIILFWISDKNKNIGYSIGNNIKLSGFGKYIFNDGSEIEGQWKDDNIEEKIEKK